LKLPYYFLPIAAGFNQRIGMNKLIGFSQNEHYILAKANASLKFKIPLVKTNGNSYGLFDYNF
jgi:hypothetical protein